MGVSGVRLLHNSWLSDDENMQVLPDVVYTVVDFSGGANTSVYLRKVKKKNKIK